MPLSIVNNNASNNAQANLNASSLSLSKSLERLSTGLKINRGADGPAALVVSEQQRAQIAGLRTALDNSNKAVSLVQTAEGALNEINALLVKARSLALDSANAGVNDATSLAANQAEITNILASIDTISATTKFGTKALLNGAASNGALTSLQAGVSVSGTLAAVPPITKTFNYTTTAAVAATSTSAAAVVPLAAGTFIVNGTTVANTALSDTTDTLVTKLNAGFSANNLAFKAENVGGNLRITATDFKRDITITGTATFTTGLPAGATRTAATTSYINTLGATVTDTAVITAANDASVVTLTGELAGAIVNLGTAASVINPAVAKFQVGEKLTFQTGANSGETTSLSIARLAANAIGLGADTTYTSLGAISVTTTAAAQAAINVIDDAIGDISTVRGNLGAFQANTLESNTRTLQATLENTISAQSIIRDTDFATEIANFTRLQTQVQAGATVLSNANQTSNLIATLLRG